MQMPILKLSPEVNRGHTFNMLEENKRLFDYVKQKNEKYKKLLLKIKFQLIQYSLGCLKYVFVLKNLYQDIHIPILKK